MCRLLLNECLGYIAGMEEQETKYDAPQGVNKSGNCSKSGCREEERQLL